VRGGVLGLLAHEVASDAQRSLIGPGEELVPLDLVVNFYRGVPPDPLMTLALASARLTHGPDRTGDRPLPHPFPASGPAVSRSQDPARLPDLARNAAW